MFEGLEYDYEESESNVETDVSEQVRELEKLKEQYMTEELEQLFAIGDEDIVEGAIEATENTEKLQKWREMLLEESADEAPDVKELVLKMQR